MEKIEEQINQQLEELRNLEKEIDNIEYEIQAYFYSVEIRIEYEEQKKYYDNKLKKIAGRLIKYLKEKDPNISKSQLLKEQEENLSEKQFALLLTIVEKHHLIDNDNSIKEIASLISKEGVLYSQLKWELNNLSTSFLNDTDLNLFLFEHIEVFRKYMPIYSSEVLFQNEEFKQLLKKEKIKTNITQTFYYEEQSVKDMEKLIEIDKNCDKQLLFAIGEIDIEYIRKNITDQNLITSFIQLTRGQNTYSDWLTNIIDYYNQEEENNSFQRMQQAVLLECDIISHYNELLKRHNGLLENSKIKKALSKARTTTIQDKLIQFLQVNEIRNSMLQDDNIYQDFLLNSINRLPEKEYGKYTHIFDSIKESSESEETKKSKLLNSFSNMKYIYFYGQNGSFTKVSTEFYQKTLNDIHNEDALAPYSEEKNPILFCDERIVNSYLENRLIDLSLRVLELGIESETIWTHLLEQARYFEEEPKIYQKSSNQSSN